MNFMIKVLCFSN